GHDRNLARARACGVCGYHVRRTGALDGGGRLDQSLMWVWGDWVWGNWFGGIRWGCDERGGAGDGAEARQPHTAALSRARSRVARVAARAKPQAGHANHKAAAAAR